MVIPTRDRLDTLRWSIQTCLTQNYENLTILVSDNSSVDGTENFIKSIADPRVKYINTRRRLGMSQNWEFALNHVSEGYVFFMGDDDGLLPGAVEKACQILSKHNVNALTWRKASYAWPNHIDFPSRNTLSVTLGNNLSIKESQKMFSRVSQFDSNLGYLSYEKLPCLYNSFVSIGSVNKTRSRSGVFFCSMNPDIYSAIALTHSVEKYLYSEEPLSINGASSHSNGTSTLKGNEDGATAKFLEEKNIPFHMDLSFSPSIPLMIAEAIFQVRDNVPGCEHYDVDINRLYIETNKFLAGLPESKQLEVRNSLEKLLKVRNIKESDLELNKQHQGLAWIIKRICKRFKYIPSFERKFNQDQVSNVYQASLVLDQIRNNEITRVFFLKAWLKNFCTIGYRSKK